MWVGLGGYAVDAVALEQVGTELDCNARGHAVSSAWYELVPGPSHQIHLGVRPGDLMTAHITVIAQRVTVSITNLSRNRSFIKTITADPIDVSSAEWILEAPSVCIDGTSSCRTLPLTNFGNAEFAVARAQPVGGGLGTIADAAWTHTKITLGPGGPEFVTNRTGTVPVGTARPSALINNGSSFKIAFRKKYVPSGTLFAPNLRGARRSSELEERSLWTEVHDPNAADFSLLAPRLVNVPTNDQPRLLCLNRLQHRLASQVAAKCLVDVAPGW
jgi:hypothetical protein